VRSRADAASTGAPTSADVTGVGVAGAGQTANVDCSLAAKDERIAKLCVNQGQGQTEATSGGGGGGSGGAASSGGSNGAASSADAKAQAQGSAGGGGGEAQPAGEGVDWNTAPNCTADPTDAATYIVYDSLGRPWGFENNQSCVFRWGAGVWFMGCWMRVF